MKIRRFTEADRADIVALWQACGLLRSWNDPNADIDRKVAHDPVGFIVGEVADRIVASAMAGYDGHRGCINYLAVNPDFQRTGMGRSIMEAAEEFLLGLGCPKINVQIRGSNQSAVAFYQRIGFSTDDVIGLGKRLIPDNPTD